MKPGASLLIVGLILAGIGVAAWQYGQSLHPSYNDVGNSYKQIMVPGGLGVMVIGGIFVLVGMRWSPKTGQVVKVGNCS